MQFVNICLNFVVTQSRTGRSPLLTINFVFVFVTYPITPCSLLLGYNSPKYSSRTSPTSFFVYQAISSPRRHPMMCVIVYRNFSSFASVVTVFTIDGKNYSLPINSKQATAINKTKSKLKGKERKEPNSR
uniref:Uncharacterized protein n=1 Tax=Ixodes ricinus TaxID=34613 RepID=A0A0K8R4H1_IXORI